LHEVKTIVLKDSKPTKGADLSLSSERRALAQSEESYLPKAFQMFEQISSTLELIPFCSRMRELWLG
jgi:hypothetical protein